MMIFTGSQSTYASSTLSQRDPALHQRAIFKKIHFVRLSYRQRTFLRAADGNNGKLETPIGSGTVVSDETVPEGHRGLHTFLYGEDGAEVHGGNNNGYRFREGEDDGSSILPVESYLKARDNEKPTGVYALYDSKRNLQYIGFARNVVLAVKAHLTRVGEDRCAFIKVMVFMNKSMATKQNLEREAQNWLDEAGTLPPGNGVESHLWDASTVKPALMSDAEIAEYEEKKIKLRMAMGENLRDEVSGEPEDAKERRLKMIQAVEGDNWSEVIDGQTAETVVGQTARPGAATQQQQVTSPFTRASVHREIGSTEKHLPGLTVAAVDKALDEVRPYLIADGGNVSVVEVDEASGRVFLELEGACGSCPSSTATMKMGIERALKAAFGDSLKEVLQVGQIDSRASLESVDQHLNILRPAIVSYGGSVEVMKVGDGVCQLRYKGPAPIATGIRAAIRDKFPDITTVDIEMEE